jgi:hypothetical protein
MAAVAGRERYGSPRAPFPIPRSSFLIPAFVFSTRDEAGGKAWALRRPIGMSAPKKKQPERGAPSVEPERDADESTESVEQEADVESARKAREPHEDKGL